MGMHAREAVISSYSIEVARERWADAYEALS
jgi:hypothetical protein